MCMIIVNCELMLLCFNFYRIWGFCCVISIRNYVCLNKENVEVKLKFKYI